MQKKKIETAFMKRFTFRNGLAISSNSIEIISKGKIKPPYTKIEFKYLKNILNTSDMYIELKLSVYFKKN